MRKMVCNAIFLISVSAAGLGFGQQDSAIYKKISREAQASGLRNAQWGVSVKYAGSGKEIVSYNQRMNLVPASTLKLLVTAAALNILGEEYKFKTKIYYSGEIAKDGYLKGNIYVVGGGDPSLGSDLAKGGVPLADLMASWVSAAKEKGIKIIDGSVIADDLLFDRVPVPGTWVWEDIGNYYCAPAGALSVNDNLYRLYFAPAASLGAGAEVVRMEPEIPELKFMNFMKTGPKGSGDNGYIYNAPGQYNAMLMGTIPAGVKEFAIKGAMPDPALFTARLFTKYLKDAGIFVAQEAGRISAPAAYNENKLVTAVDSPPLKEIVFITNKKSFNFYAEMLLRALAVNKSGIGSIEAGIEAEREFLSLAGIDTKEIRLFDAAGLSRFNMISAEGMTDLLVFMANQGRFSAYYESFVEPGDYYGFGHIKTFGIKTELEKRLRIKSGSLKGVRSYCGYLKGYDGRLAAFSFIINNYSCSPEKIEQIHESILLSILRESKSGSKGPAKK